MQFRISPQPCPVELNFGPLSLACSRAEGHDGAHLATGVAWTDTSAAGIGERPWPPSDDDQSANTVKFPPIRETVHLRRPPPRELRGPDLLRALAAEIERELAEDEAADEDGPR